MRAWRARPIAGLPAAALVLTRLAGRRGLEPRVLALLEPALDQRDDHDQRRERGDDDEAGLGDHLVVGLAPPALATVVRERERGDGQQEPRGQQRRLEGLHHGEGYPRCPMAVVIASDLAKDMAGEPLLRGVSFKLERRDRMTLSGRNGSGKTTLLRMLSGESGIDGGELAFAKDVKVALHDQRPPRDRDLTLRDYVLSGCKDLLDLEAQLASLEADMANGAMNDGTLDAYARAQTRLEHAGGYNWRESVNSTL